jgi:hypothetical protein
MIEPMLGGDYTTGRQHGNGRETVDRGPSGRATGSATRREGVDRSNGRRRRDR